MTDPDKKAEEVIVYTPEEYRQAVITRNAEEALYDQDDESDDDGDDDISDLDELVALLTEEDEPDKGGQNH